MGDTNWDETNSRNQKNGRDRNSRDKEIEIKIQIMIRCLEDGRMKKRIPHGVTKIQDIKRMVGTEIQETKKDKVGKIRTKDKEIEIKIQRKTQDLNSGMTKM